MRILVLGAGGVGGYFGGRLLEAGRDVTFLVRPGRAEKLAATGLVVRSRHGDLDIPAPPTVTADAVREPFDLVLLSCKAYDLDDAIRSVSAAVGPETMILPLLNGYAHIPRLDREFGAARILGGLCFISTALDDQGRILHFSPMHSMVFGEREAAPVSRLAEVDAALSGAGFDGRLSDSIEREMWEKWVFIAALAGVTCLMRASIGAIIEAGGEDIAREMLQEAASIAAANGFPPSRDAYERSLGMATAPRSTLAASMLRDIESGARTEADHIIGELLRRDGGGHGSSPTLRIALTHLLAYEARRSSAMSTAD